MLNMFSVIIILGFRCAGFHNPQTPTRLYIGQKDTTFLRNFKLGIKKTVSYRNSRTFCC